jgi:hypothetical protein
MVEYTRYPWVRVYVCDACGAPTFDCRSHAVDGITPWRFMIMQPHLYSHHYKHHRAPVVAPAYRPDHVKAEAGVLAVDDDEPPLHPPVLHPPVVPPPLTRWLWADCTTLDRHRAVKAIMAKALYGTVAILPTAVAQITREDMLQYLTMAQLLFTVGSTGRALLGRLLGPLYVHVCPTPVLPWPATSLASCLPRPPIVELDEQDYMVPL